MTYNFKKIEVKWQKKWEKEKVFEVKEKTGKGKKKYYVLEMYPYPSADFLHMGHVRNYTIGDVYARFKRMNGFNVLYPMGYDSFGLPAETAAKKKGIHPKKYTESAIKKIIQYQKELGNSYDWSRSIASHDPDYYRWNQFFFLKFFEKGLAYRKKAPVNWCPNCKSVLANEEAETGKCWRCGQEVTKKELEQWFFRITKYAERLLNDLDKIKWPEKIKVMQRNWIGKSEGLIYRALIKDMDLEIETFSTHFEACYADTFVVIAPDHPFLPKLVEGTIWEKKVKDFCKKILNKRARKGYDSDKEIEGIFTGKYLVDPLGNGDIPLWVSSYAIADYGTGIVKCSAHDQRDFEFAKKYDIPLKVVLVPRDSKLRKKVENFEVCFTDMKEGILLEPKEVKGKRAGDCREIIINHCVKNGFGKKKIQYKIRDWLISRQRYWGTPIPIIYCDKCGIVPVPEKDLPVKLPEKVNFKSKKNPLFSSKSFVNVRCPKCKGKAKRETDTMGGFVDSSWYFLRYCDNKNKNNPFDKKKVKYWMPVDQYIGGAEHAVMHLMYARFFIKALRDLGYVDFEEPFSKLFNQGIVYKDGSKMSKSKGNIVFQTEILNRYGIDTARLFLMFVSSPDKQMEWNDDGVGGSFRIINKLIRLLDKVKNKKNDKRTDSKLNLMIKKVTENIENFNYPKAIISFTGFLDYLDDLNEIPKRSFEELLKIISLFCPHITEELWEKIGNKSFISLEKWPIADEKKIDENLEKQEQSVEKLVEDINHILKIVEGKKKKVFVYVLPNKKQIYAGGLDLIEKKTGLEVEIFAVNDKDKYDPENKSKKVKPGRPGIYLE